VISRVVGYFVNSVAFAVIVVQYVKSNISSMTEDVPDELMEHYQGCCCESQICSSTSDCSCLRRFGSAFDKHGRLLDVDPNADILRPVIECNDLCSCGKLCSNRVVQHGVTVKLQVFGCGHRGVGVRTLEPISRGSFVCEYAGEVLTYGSAKRRSENADAAMHNYILTMREFFGAKSLTTYVDATYVGNVARFINHSCEPNLFVQPVRVENAIPRVALFALHDIPGHAELTYDYSGGGSSTAGEDSNLPWDSCECKLPRKPCLCGSSNCNQFLPYGDMLFVPHH